MKNITFLQQAKPLEIQVYKRPKDVFNLRKTHVAFTGSPRKHPYDPDKIILIVDPFSTNTVFYEFHSDDISYLDEMPNLVSMQGKTVPMMRVWVKKKSIGILCTPFLVENTITDQ
jgi:inorganic pyrophosphatase